MSKNRFPFSLLTVALFVLLAGSATAQANDEEFGSKIAGSWLGHGSFGLDFNCDGVADSPPGPAFVDVHTYGVGGTYMATNPGNPNSGNGAWEKTGPRQISGRTVTFINVLALVNDINNVQVQVPTTGLNLIAVISIVVDFDKGFETATTTFGAKLYTPTQDPLDPSEVPLLCTAGGHDSFGKVSATE